MQTVIVGANTPIKRDILFAKGIGKNNQKTIMVCQTLN